MPFIPHFANECFEKLEQNENKDWPKIEDKYLKSEFCNIVIQINGKKREIIKMHNNINEEELITEINKSDKLKPYLAKKEIFRKIFIKNKLINLIIK